MLVTTKELGYREMYKLAQFIQIMINNFPNDIIDCLFSYDLEADEPFISNMDNQLFYASDYDIAFDISGTDYII